MRDMVRSRRWGVSQHGLVQGRVAARGLRVGLDEAAGVAENRAVRRFRGVEQFIAI